MKLYPYQEKYLSKLPPSCIMAADLGTGKTIMSLAHWQRQNTGRSLLIVAPASKIRTGDWEQEAARWFDVPKIMVKSKIDSSVIELKPGTIIPVKSSSDIVVKLPTPHITYISYESLRLMDKETKRPRWWKYTGARNGGRVYDVIADECHALKNPQSKQSKALLEIKQSGGLFIGLSGTPMPNGWIDFAGYSKLFGYVKGITEFKSRYCIIQDFKGFPEIIGYRNEEVLNKQFKEIAFKLGREEANELPDRQLIPVNIEMSNKDINTYMKAKVTRTDPRSGEMLDSSGKLLSYLRQSTTHARLDNMLSVVGDTDDNVIIFYNYISERKAILKALEKSGKTILRYDGEKHDKLPESTDDVKNIVLLAHYKSASTGLNLQFSNIIVFFSLTYSYQEYTQAKGRIWRNGQTKKCLFYVFRVKGTIDDQIIKCLGNKQDFNAKLWYNDSYGQKDV